MKSTLFNTMLGCLAALSLAGCGGHNNDDAASSSSSSSSVPGLLNPGKTFVEIGGKLGNSRPYRITLRQDGICSIEIIGESISFNGQWQDKTDSGDAFTIAFVKPFTTNTQNALISLPDTVKLTFPDGGLESYRAGNPVSDAVFDTSPFSYSQDNNTETAKASGLFVLTY